MPRASYPQVRPKTQEEPLICRVSCTPPRASISQVWRPMSSDEQVTLCTCDSYCDAAEELCGLVVTTRRRPRATSGKVRASLRFIKRATPEQRFCGWRD